MSRFRARANHVLFWVLFLNVVFVFNTIATSKETALTLAGYLSQYAVLYGYVECGRVIGTCYLSLWVFTHWFLPKNVLVIFLQVIALGILDATLSYVLSQKIGGPLIGLEAVWVSRIGTPKRCFGRTAPTESLQK